MTAATRTNHPPIDEPAATAYRQAEQLLWGRLRIKATERFVPIDEPPARLRVVEVGEGEPIVFVPGTGGVGPYWAPLAAQMTGFRCLLLDRPGWGLSTPIDYSKYGYGDVAARVLAGLFRAMGIETAHVVGASIGCLWALRLAQREASLVDRVVLLGGFPYPGWPPHRFLQLLASPLGALLVRLPTPAAVMRRQLRDIGHGPSLDAGRFPDEFFSWRVAFARHTDSMRHERDMVRVVVGRHGLKPAVSMGRAELAEIERPVLMVWGTADPVGSVEVWKNQISVIPHGELSVIKDGGHLVWWDDPEQVGSLVRGFLKR